MKIAMVVPVFPKLSETFIVSKFLGLLERGHYVHIICQRFDREALTFFPELGRRDDLARHVMVRRPAEPRWRAIVLAPCVAIRLVAVEWRKFYRYLAKGWRKFGSGVLRQWYLDAAIVECGADVIHFEFGALAPGRLEQARWTGAKTLVSFRGHDLLFVGLDRKEFYREVWEQAGALHFLGTGLWSKALQRGCPPAKPHCLIAPAVNTNFFEPAGREPYGILGMSQRPIRLVSVARLDWTKGLEYALQAVARLRNLDVVLEYRIAGGGDYRDALVFAVEQLGLEDVVTFLGDLPPEGVRNALEWADIFLHGAVAEGFCNALLEAQAMELPVVTSDSCGLPENVADGVTGFVVPRRNALALAEKVLELAANPDLRREMGRAARQRVLAEFDLANQVDRFERLYESVLASGPDDRPEAVAAVPTIENRPLGQTECIHELN